MVRLRCQGLLATLILAGSLHIATTAARAEIRSKPATTGPTKSVPEKSTRAKTTPSKKGTVESDQTRSADNPSGASDVDPLADDDAPKVKPSSKNTKAKAKKKGEPKEPKDSKSSAGKRPRGSPSGDTESNQQGLVGVELNLEPET